MEAVKDEKLVVIFCTCNLNSNVDYFSEAVVYLHTVLTLCGTKIFIQHASNVIQLI